MKKKEITDILFIGVSGKFGDKVYYSRNRKTFKRKAPGSYNKIPSKKQVPRRELFQEGTWFAKAIIANPVLKTLYKKRARPGQSAYNRALSEYLKGEVPAAVRGKVQYEFIVYDRIAVQKLQADDQQSNDINHLIKTMIITDPAFNKQLKASPLKGSSTYGTVVSQYLSGWVYS